MHYFFSEHLFQGNEGCLHSCASSQPGSSLQGDPAPCTWWGPCLHLSTHHGTTELPWAPSDVLQRPDTHVRHLLSGKTSHKQLAFHCHVKNLLKWGAVPVQRWHGPLCTGRCQPQAAVNASGATFPGELSPISAGMQGALSTPGPRPGGAGGCCRPGAG